MSSEPKNLEKYQRISSLSDPSEAGPSTLRCLTRVRRVLERYGYRATQKMSIIMEQALVSAAEVLYEPRDHYKAISSPDAEKWMKAKQKKLSALAAAGT